MPTLFFTLVRGPPPPPQSVRQLFSRLILGRPQVLPELQPDLRGAIGRYGLLLFGLTALCFFATGCVNPGVPRQPEQRSSRDLAPGQLPHPGEGYSLSRDTNRYVEGFDHFCEFVGNDIGRGNLGCFVSFLVLLSLLSTMVAVLSGWQVVAFFADGVWHVLAEPWCALFFGVSFFRRRCRFHVRRSEPLLLRPLRRRLIVAAVLVGSLVYGLVSCANSAVCSGVLPLIMMMPGATTGAILIIVVLAATVLLPLTTDMLADVSAERNPTGFFLILPALCFAVLFWGMSIHWVFLLADGLTQKLWLRSKGYRKARKPAEPPSSTGDPNLALV